MLECVRVREGETGRYVPSYLTVVKLGGMTEAASATPTQQFEALTTVYERLRHSTDAAELSEFARRPLPDKSDQSGYSRATALLEAVAGNPHTPLEDRIFLAQTMPFPNILVKLAQDESVEVRKAVAANEQDKNWLVGRLTKDESPEVREIALRNARTSWKMRLEGAQDPRTSPETLEFLAGFGGERAPGGPDVLTSMIRRAVALNPNTSPDVVSRLASDPSPEVRNAAQRRLATR